MAFVLDASVTLAWSLPDEQDQRALRLLEKCRQSSAAVPAHWSTEVLNGLLMAERKSRISREQSEELVLSIAALPITKYPASLDGREVIDLARQHNLTVYDAAYLQLAEELQLGLATFDDAIIRAAMRLGLILL